MGRPRKSIAEHVANGTYRPSRHGGAAVEPGPGDGPAETIERPTKLGAEAARIWEELAELLAGSIRKRDVPALVELARWIARSDRIAELLDSLDPTDKDFKGLLVQAGIATDKVSDLTKRFGISPADRAKLKAIPSVNGPAVAKVPTRPQTKLDRAGKPAKGKAAKRKGRK
jgi:hypothetical protein